jgi:predicted PurR-regulated permease PerM
MPDKPMQKRFFLKDAANAAVGFGTAAVMWLTGVGDPILWGTVAFLLNFVPILGPSIFSPGGPIDQ